MILPLFIRTLSEFFCFSRRVPGSGLYGRRSSTQSRYFLIINIHNIAAKVRAVELAGGKICDPSGILAMETLTWPQRTPKFYSSRAQRAFIGLFVVVERQCNTAFLCWLEWGALEHNVTEGRLPCSPNPRMHLVQRTHILASTDISGVFLSNIAAIHDTVR